MSDDNQPMADEVRKLRAELAEARRQEALRAVEAGDAARGEAWGSSFKMPSAGGVILACVALLVLWAQFSAPKTASERQAAYCVEDAGLGKAHAIVAARNGVEALLVSPGSASYSGEAVGQQKEPCMFAVIGTVDAQNRFGALLRRRYIAKVVYEPGPDRWTATGAELVGK